MPCRVLRFLLPLVCLHLGAAAAAPLRVCGSSTILPILQRVAEVNALGAAGTLLVEGGGSGRGIDGTLSGACDVGMVSRRLHPGESPALQHHTIGYDGIAVVISSSVGVPELSRQAIRDIFEGRLANWSQLAGADAEIFVVAKQEGRSTRRLFDAYFQVGHLSAKALLVGSNTEALVMVASDPAAIGYVSIGSAEHALEHHLPVRMLPLDGVAATRANVAGGAYPLRRDLNLVTRGQPDAAEQVLIDFLRSDRGQAMVRAQHYVGLGDAR